MAQQAVSHPAACKAMYPHANCRNTGPGSPVTGSYQYYRSANAWDRDANWNDGWHDSRNDVGSNDNRWDRRYDSRFWPGDVTASVAGAATGTADAAIGTAGAVATAPFRSDAYAYYNGDSDGYTDNVYRGGPHQSYAPQRSYAQLNGFVCQPGTRLTGEDGRRHLCQ